MTGAQGAGDPPREKGASAHGDLSRVRAIALDTNSFGGRLPHIGRLAGLARRAKQHGHIEVWVPESVLWEWTEHIHSDLQSTEKALDGLRKTGRSIPALTTPSLLDIEDDLREQLAKIGPPLRLLPVGDVAGDALRDQVLLLGPARAKPARDGSVKTGAADSAHLRAFEMAASGDTSTYVVVSSDGDIASAYKKWGRVGPRPFKDLKSATDAVFASVPSSTAVSASCVSLLTTRLDDLDLGRLNGQIAQALYGDRDPGIFANEEFYAEEGLQSVGITGVEVDLDGNFAHGTVHLLAVVRATGLVQDESGDSLVQEWREATGAHIRITATFDLVGGAATEVVVDTDEGVVTFSTAEEAESEDEALDLVLDALTALPGLENLDWNPLGGSPNEYKVESGFGEIALTFETEAIVPDDIDPAAWTLRAEHANGVGEVTCHFLNDAAWDKEASDLFPGHFALSTTVGGLARFNPAWAINALVIGLSDYDPTDMRNYH